MPTINLSGSSGSDPKQNKDAAFSAYERSQGEAAKKNAQIDAAFDKKETANAARRASESEALWRREASQKKSQMDAESRLFAQEMSARIAALNADKAREQEKQRQDGIRKQIDNTQRKNYDAMRKRADGDNQEFSRKQNFATKQWAAMRRDADEDNRDYNLKRKMRERQEANIRRNDPNTYRAENVGRLGLQGMRSAERNDWRGLHQSERELDQIQRKFGNNPGVAAAMAQARGRIRAGGEGNPSWLMSLGRATGAVQDMGLLEGGGYALGGARGGAIGMAAYGAFKAGKAVLDAPMSINNYVQSMMGVASPYMDLRSGLASMGRAGGANSQDLEDAFRSNGRNQDWLQRYGLSRGSSAQMLGQFGIVPGTVGEGVGAVRSIAGAAYSMGMNPSEIAGYAGSAANLGLTDSKDTKSGWSLDEYLKKVQRITTTAVSQGMNQSQATGVLEGLFKQATTANTATLGNGSGIADLWTKMMQAGTPSARSGASTASMIAGAQSFANDIGFDTQNPARAQVMASYIDRHGGAKAFGAGGTAVSDLIGKERYAGMMSSPGGRETLRKIEEAAKSGNSSLLMNALVPVMGDVDTVQRTIEGSYIHDMPEGPWKEISKQNVGGGAQQATNDFNATKGFDVNAGSADDDSVNGRARKLYAMFRNQGWDAHASADMVANALIEAPGLNPHAFNTIDGGHHGLFQLGKKRQALFRSQKGFDITDPRATAEVQADFNNWELHHTESATGKMFKRGIHFRGNSIFSRFDERPGNADAEASNRGDLGDNIGPSLESSYMASGANSYAEGNKISSQAEDLATGAGQTEFERLKAGAQVLGDTLVNISSGAEKLNAAFFQLATTVGTLNGSLGRSGGGGMNIPSMNPFGGSTPYDLRPLGKG